MASNSFTQNSFTQNQLNSEMNFSPFEQEKMSFYEYWKSPEQKKIENTFKNSTNFTSAHENSFRVFQKKENFFQKIPNISIFLQVKNSILFFSKKEKKKRAHCVLQKIKKLWFF
jgi:hypothetical protein